MEKLEKQALLSLVASLDDEEKLLQVQRLIIGHHAEQSEKEPDEYEKIIADLLSKSEIHDEGLIQQVEIPTDTTAKKWLHQLSPYSFYHACISLILLGLALTYGVEKEDSSLEGNYYFWAYLATYLFAWIEYGMFYFHFEAHPSQVWAAMATLVFPPMRIGQRHSVLPDYLWLPFIGWCKANETLFDTLKRKFSTPMIAIALFIVPILMIEMKFEEQARAAIPNIDFYIFLVQAFIWIAFTFEFILMFSITNEKADYCKRNWMDLVIILLPLISFFRTFRMLRILKLQQLSKAYRVKGVFLKVRNAILLADAIQRILYPNPSTHLLALQKKLINNSRQRKELERQVLVAVERYRKQKEKISNKVKK